MHRDESERMPLPGVLATTGVMLLVASKMSDWLEPYLGFDVLNIAFAFTVALTAASLIAALTYDLLNSRAARSRSRPSHTATTSILVTAGTAALAVFGIEHLHHRPALDGWLGVAGGLLILAAALANHRGAGRHSPRATPPHPPRTITAPPRG